jgi:flagellar hook protein FlgE
MSIALFNAVSGLSNFQRVLDVVGNNLANMSTPGYKRNAVSFRELFSQTIRASSAPTDGGGGINPLQVGLGSSVGSISTQYTQGMLENTGRPTDLAITGNGFFVLGRGNDRVYTRNGGFSLDVDGYLINDNGYYVQGWQAVDGTITATGEPTNLQIPVGGNSIAKATSTVTFNGNLDASQALYNAGPPETGGKYTTENVVYDSLGRAITVKTIYTKVDSGDPNKSKWDWESTIDGASVGTGSLVYNADGSYDAANSTANPQIAYVPGGGAADMTVDLKFDASTCVATNGVYSMIASGQDGYKAGAMQSFNVDEQGRVIGTYSNGLTQVIGQIAIADFVNPEGLERSTGGLLRETANSGAAQIGPANTATRGSISSGALELSNVDMSTEFSKMIIAQRAFQANSRVVSVVDEMMQELANLKR